MFEQRRAPMVKCSHGGDGGYLNLELAAQVVEQRARHHLKGIQRTSAHFRESQVQGGAKLIQSASAGTKGSPLRVIEREKVAELEGGQLARKLLLAKEGELPRLHTGAPNTVLGLQRSAQPLEAHHFCNLAESLCFAKKNDRSELSTYFPRILFRTFP